MQPETINLQNYSQRWQTLGIELQKNHLDALVLNPGPSLVYFTGLHFHLSERPVLFIFVNGQDPRLVLPELELAKTQGLSYPLRTIPYGEDPTAWPAAFHEAVNASGFRLNTLGIEPRRLRLLEFGYLSSAAPDAKIINAENSIASLRMRKDASEILAMRRAVEIAQNALIAMLNVVKIGITEYELAGELSIQLLRHGSDPDIPFAPIVSAGPNSANPHATPTHRSIKEGDLLVIDWGASHQGYYSDITRTFAIGNVEAEEQQICQVVIEANKAGRLAVHPGTSAHKVDIATRSIVESAGYGKFFTHRTGHGIGLEGHEEPFIRAGNDFALLPGMTFTIEPGIYLPGRNGVRIEDDVVVTDDGMISLTTIDREIVRLG